MRRKRITPLSEYLDIVQRLKREQVVSRPRRNMRAVRWTKEDDAKLRAILEGGGMLKDAAKALGMKDWHVRYRAQELRIDYHHQATVLKKGTKRHVVCSDLVRYLRQAEDF